MRINRIKNVKSVLFGAVMGLALAGSARAAGTTVSTNVTTSTTWTKAMSPINLGGKIYVTNGATLTIEPGVVVASLPDPATGNGIDNGVFVCRDGKIKVMGTATDPVIMTSAADLATWTGSVVVNDPGGFVTSITTMGNPKTGTWRASTQEWGNLTIMGNALIGGEKTSDNSNFGATGAPQRQSQDGAAAPVVTNTGTPTGLNKELMEGLTPDFVGDPKQLYGGGDDDDNRGEVHYLSMRYGGKVLAINVELNGMSMGGVGRGTQIDHIDIMNCLDDAIETWGGTVNYKYVNLWNYGDDGFDVDQGWRGKAQFGLLVQGYARTGAAQGSGVSDNGFEIDGAEGNDAIPCTTATIYNFTLIGQPDNQGGPATNGGDQAIAMRDSARVQFRQCIFMSFGEHLIKEEASEAPGTNGWRYGTFGTLPWVAAGTANDVWDLPFTDTWDLTAGHTGAHANMSNYLGAGVGVHMSVGDIQNMYRAQSQGNNLGSHNQGYLMELTDSVFFNNPGLNIGGNAYDVTDVVGPNPGAGLTVTVAGGSSPSLGNVVAAASPITTLGRGTVTAIGVSSLFMANVISLDPRAANDAATSVDTAPLDGFFTPTRYRGAFSPTVNWIQGWTAASAYGFLTGPANPAQPTATFAVQLTTTTFFAVAGQTYAVESSVDGRNWSPFATVVGDGATHTVSALSGFDATKLYRVIVQ